MSYCRINDESDVYCWTCDNEQFYISTDRADPSNAMFSAIGLGNLLWLLLKLKEHGFRVPGEAFDRIGYEIAEEARTADESAEATPVPDISE